MYLQILVPLLLHWNERTLIGNVFGPHINRTSSTSHDFILFHTICHTIPYYFSYYFKLYVIPYINIYIYIFHTIFHTISRFIPHTHSFNLFQAAMASYGQLTIFIPEKWTPESFKLDPTPQTYPLKNGHCKWIRLIHIESHPNFLANRRNVDPNFP